MRESVVYRDSGFRISDLRAQTINNSSIAYARWVLSEYQGMIGAAGNLATVSA